MARSVYDLRSTPLRSTPAPAAAGDALPYAPGCAPRPVQAISALIDDDRGAPVSDWLSPGGETEAATAQAGGFALVRCTIGSRPLPVAGVAPAAAVDTHAVPIDLLAERMALRARA